MKKSGERCRFNHAKKKISKREKTKKKESQEKKNLVHNLSSPKKRTLGQFSVERSLPAQLDG